MKKISSPCIKNCKYDYSFTFCTGCYRSGEEITNWVYLSEEKRLEIIRLLPTRKRKINNL